MIRALPRQLILTPWKWCFISGEHAISSVILLVLTILVMIGSGILVIIVIFPVIMVVVKTLFIGIHKLVTISYSPYCADRIKNTLPDHGSCSL